MKPDMRDLLPKLRQIGFGIWDPLGLATAWEDGEPMADEYDSTLIRAYSAAANGRGLAAISAVLHDSETRMGLELGPTTDGRDRAARAILRLAMR